MTKEEFFERFEIQTRAKSQGNFSAYAYLVIYDKKKQEFIKMKDSKRAYQEFRNFKDAVDFCEEYLKNEKNS